MEDSKEDMEKNTDNICLHLLSLLFLLVRVSGIAILEGKS